MPNNILDQLTKPLVKANPYIHMLFFGEMGSGKSETSARCARGIYKYRREHQGESRPIVIVNPEKSARWLLDDFKAEKIPVQVSESSSVSDLIKIMDAVGDGAAASLIIDPMTRHWYSFINAYKQKKGLSFMTLEHWGKVIPEWRDLFSERLSTAPFDYFICGRSGFKYEMEKDDETGKKSFVKSGVKPKLEGETGYEPDLVVYTELEDELVEGNLVTRVKQTFAKTRYKPFFGKSFINPTWENYSPAFFFLLEGAQEDVKIPAGDDTPLIGSNSGFEAKKERRQIAIENIEGELTSLVPGQSREEKKWKVDALQVVFNTRSWTEIERLPAEVLELGLSKLKRMAEQARQNIGNGVPIGEVLEESLKDLAGAV